MLCHRKQQDAGSDGTASYLSGYRSCALLGEAWMRQHNDWHQQKLAYGWNGFMLAQLLDEMCNILPNFLEHCAM